MSITAQSTDASVTAYVSGLASALGATIGVTVVRSTGVTAIARVTSPVEIVQGSGSIYSYTFSPASLADGSYLVTWDFPQGAGTGYLDEDLTVKTTGFQTAATAVAVSYTASTIPGLTPSAMIAEMQDHGFQDISTSRLLGFLNDAQYKLCATPYPFLLAQATITTTAGISALALPADFNAVSRLTDKVNGITVTPERWERVQSLQASNATQTGVSALYYWMNGTINVWPLPTGGTLTLTYYKYPPALDLTTNAPSIIPSAHHRLLVLDALVKAYMMNDDTDIAVGFKAEYQDRLKAAEDDFWKYQFDRTEAITVLDYDYYM